MSNGGWGTYRNGKWERFKPDIRFSLDGHDVDVMIGRKTVGTSSSPFADDEGETVAVEVAFRSYMASLERGLVREVTAELSEFDPSIGKQHDVSHPPGELVEVLIKSGAGAAAGAIITAVAGKIRSVLKKRKESKEEDWREDGGYL